MVVFCEKQYMILAKIKAARAFLNTVLLKTAFLKEILTLSKDLKVHIYKEDVAMCRDAESLVLSRKEKWCVKKLCKPQEWQFWKSQKKWPF